MIKKVVAEVVSLDYELTELGPTAIEVGSGLESLDRAQVEVAAAYAIMKVNNVTHEPEWAEGLQERILNGEVLGIFVDWPITIEEVMEELLD